MLSLLAKGLAGCQGGEKCLPWPVRHRVAEQLDGAVQGLGHAEAGDLIVDSLLELLDPVAGRQLRALLREVREVYVWRKVGGNKIISTTGDFGSIGSRQRRKNVPRIAHGCSECMEALWDHARPQGM